MKRFLSILLCGLVALSLTACGGNEESNTYTESEITKAQNLQRSTYFSDTGKFVNSYTGVTVAVPGDWYVCLDEEIAQVVLEGSTTGDELSMWTQADFETQPIIPDFVVMDTANGNIISVSYENLAVTGAQGVTGQEYVEKLAKELEGDGCTVSQPETVTLSGMEFDLVTATLTKDGAAHSRYIAARRFEDYMMVVTSSGEESKSPEMFKLFFE